MQQFDVVIIGAGPAGGYAAWLLAQKGFQVLLVEQLTDFSQHNFSSAATPIETIKQFNLPEEVIAAYWRKISIISTKKKQSWQQEQPLGVVFDFAKLRSYLAQKVTENQGQVWLGHRYLSHYQEAGKIQVKLKQKGAEMVEVSTQVLVDATGHRRAVMSPNRQKDISLLKGTGIEYLIQVDQETYQKYADHLLFFLGYHWSPKGYSWIFPMDNYQLKVGSAFIEGNHQFLNKLKPLRDYTKAIIQNYLKLDNYHLVEIHGSIVSYASGLTDIYYQDNLIAIGDAVSTINWLGGEGIRPGMQGAAIAVKHIEDYLTGKCLDFVNYEKEMKNTFRKKWDRCETISNQVYLQYSDEKIDLGVTYLKYLKVKDIMDILFNYEFDKIYRGFYPFLLKKITQFLQLTGRGNS